ncbi:amidohydrolase family protein [Pseudoroseomonas globiformis]|uniref:Amidohydrolase family protein n=1 Tax=Teichococcus globiformis TaxID=2307229 RepID=A0ABV7G0L3_9PROT
MPLTRRAALSAALASLSVVPGTGLAQPREGGVALRNARIFADGRFTEPSTLLISDGRVRAVAAGLSGLPEGVRGIDMAGHYIVPGMTSAHVHVGHAVGLESGPQFYTRDTVEAQLQRYAAFGVTQVAALGMGPPLFHALREESRAGRLRGATLRGAGPGLGVTDGAPPAGPMRLADNQVLRPRDEAEVRSAVDRLAAAGIDQVKIWIEDANGQLPMMSPEIVRAAVQAAHRHNLPVVAHVHDLSHARLAVSSGVDILGHGIRDEPVDEALVAAMRQAGTRYIPTIQIDEAEYLYTDRPELADDAVFQAATTPAFRSRMADSGWRETQSRKGEQHRDAVRMNQRNLLTLHRAGVPVALGTDSGATPLRVQGFAEHRELALMVEAGLSPADVLRIATEGSAALLGDTDRGVLRPGARADFAVLAADPLENIANIGRIAAVWQDGREVAGRLS